MNRPSWCTARALVIFPLGLALVAGSAWAFWPAVKWPSAFCQPVGRVISSDLTSIDAARTRYSAEPLPAQWVVWVTTLLADIALAQEHAPTPTLSRELATYTASLSKATRPYQIVSAIGEFDVKVRTQLRACGIWPLGKP